MNVVNVQRRQSQRSALLHHIDCIDHEVHKNLLQLAPIARYEPCGQEVLLYLHGMALDEVLNQGQRLQHQRGGL